jgi:hypothetical protein
VQEPFTNETPQIQAAARIRSQACYAGIGSAAVPFRQKPKVSAFYDSFVRENGYFGSITRFMLVIFPVNTKNFLFQIK